MKRKIICCVIAWVFLAVLPSCEERQPELIDTQVWETAPVLNYGVLEYEKLQILPWNSGRTEATGQYNYAETADGFYIRYHTHEYVDKFGSSAWVSVCNKPNCTHPGNSRSCNATIGVGFGFVLRGDRLYMLLRMEEYRQLCPPEYKESFGRAVFSRALNGTDLRFEYTVDEAVVSDGVGGSTASLINGQHWLHNVNKMNPDGTYTACAYRVSRDGLEILYQETFDNYNDAYATTYLNSSPFFGDPVFYNYALGRELYGIRDGEIYEVAATKYADGGGYLSGNTLRQFRPNEGYFDIDTETGEEILVTQNRIQNSQGWVMLPNCIIETTLGSKSHESGASHSMEFFDGEGWHTVTLPEELVNSNDLRFFFAKAVASDRILFICKVGNVESLYQILLGTGEPELTLLGIYQS